MSKRNRELARELKRWQEGEASFTSALFELLSQAGERERQKLFTVFSEEVRIWEEWRDDPENFLMRYNLK